MLKKQEKFEDSKGQNQENQDEELYQRLFKKIARDFVYIKDLDILLDGFYEKIQEAQQNNKKMNKEEMKHHSKESVKQAMEYKNNLSLPKDKRKEYEDIPDE